MGIPATVLLPSVDVQSSRSVLFPVTLPVELFSTNSLTVVDSDGATNSTTASLTVNKAVDYPPVANAGPNQVITLPQNSITLFGNQSTDDHGITSYEWSLSPSSKGKVVEMQVGKNTCVFSHSGDRKLLDWGQPLKVYLVTKVRFVHLAFFFFFKSPNKFRKF